MFLDDDDFEDEFSSCGSTVADESAVAEMLQESSENTPPEMAESVVFIDQIRNAINERHGQWFIYDLETVPDETRFPQPVQTERPDADVNVEELVGQTADDIVKVLGRLSDPQLSTLMDLEGQSKRPRKTVIEAIKRAFVNLDSETDQWKHFALEPFKCRIVALSFAFLDSEIFTLTAETLEEELLILEILALLFEHCRRSGFNITGFDDRVVAARFMIRQIHSGKPINMKRWNSGDRFELMDALFGQGTTMKCKETALILGIPVPAGDIDGSQVLSLVQSGQWNVLRDYSASDVFVERKMFEIARRYVEV